MSSLSAKKRVVALCVADDPVMTQTVISNLLIAAGQTASLLEKQIGKYSEYDSEERLWREFIETISDEWVEAREKLDLAQAGLELFDEPKNQPLGLIGTSMEAPFIDEADALYQAALAEFNAIDEKLRKCDSTLIQYNKVSTEFNSAQKKKKYVKKIRNALGMLEGSMDLSQIALATTLSVPLPSLHGAEPPSEEDLETLTSTLHDLVSSIPQNPDPTPEIKTKSVFERLTGFFKSRCHSEHYSSTENN